MFLPHTQRLFLSVHHLCRVRERTIKRKQGTYSLKIDYSKILLINLPSICWNNHLSRKQMTCLFLTKMFCGYLMYIHKITNILLLVFLFSSTGINTPRGIYTPKGIRKMWKIIDAFKFIKEYQNLSKNYWKHMTANNIFFCSEG